MHRFIIILALLSSLSCHGQLAQHPHPRLWMNPTTKLSIDKKIANDPLAQKLQRTILLEADRVTTARTCIYDIPDGRRLLRESRYALNNIAFSAWAWRMTGEQKYRLRAIKELDAACSLVDWNPGHFLDTAEMATAVALGYDWLYLTLSEKQRGRYRKALVEKALIPAKIRFDRNEWWTTARNNWAQVCGAGIGIAAIAITGDETKLSAEILPQCVALVQRCKKFYEPDGLYPEGPGYWYYGTKYHVMLLAACNEIGYSMEVPQLLGKSGDSMLHLTSPNLLSFNFSDGSSRVVTPSLAQCWIASNFKAIGQARRIRNRLAKAISEGGSTLKIKPFNLLWLPDAPAEADNLPTEAFYNGEQSAAIFRTDWSDDAAWFAIKGGTPEGGHGHMDVGSFCYDAKGLRWVHDLGGDNYNMPGYFQEQRFTYYRLQNRAHNTLEIAAKLQDESCEPCPIIAKKSGPTNASATFDLSHAYVDSAKAVTRSAMFEKTTGRVRITDTISSPAGKVVWRALTRANCVIDGNSVVLTQDGKSISFILLSNKGSWTIESASPPMKIENPNEGYRVVTLTVPQQDSVSIDIEIRP